MSALRTTKSASAVAETGRWPSLGAAVRCTLNLSFTSGRTDDSLYAAETDRSATGLEVRELELSTHCRPPRFSGRLTVPP